MNDSEKFLVMFGGIFFAVGIIVLLIGLVLIFGPGELAASAICILIGFIFMAVGGGILFAQLKGISKRKKASKAGKKYTGKIYGYVEDKRAIVNNDYLVNIKVHYFDENGIEREAVIPTGFAKGSGDYPIGATIDIIALGSVYSWDKNSVRYEHIDREEELMDNKPLDPKLIDMVAVTCPYCGAKFSAAKGYVCNCAYCGAAINN